MGIVDFHEDVGADLCVYAIDCDECDEGIWWRWLDFGGSKPTEEKKSSEFVWWRWPVDDGRLDAMKEERKREILWRRMVHCGCKSMRERKKRVQICWQSVKLVQVKCSKKRKKKSFLVHTFQQWSLLQIACNLKEWFHHSTPGL